MGSGAKGDKYGVREKFTHWVNSKADFLEKNSISIEYVKYEKSEEEIPDPNTAVIYETKSYIGQVLVWESRQMEYELIEIVNPEKFVLWKYIEKVEEEPNFDLILFDFLDLLKEK